MSDARRSAAESFSQHFADVAMAVAGNLTRPQTGARNIQHSAQTAI
jgi:hypothetical protein